VARSPTDRIAQVRAAVQPFVAEIADLAARIAAVPAPTGEEQDRSRFVAVLFTRSAVADVTVDDLGDVVATVRGAGPSAASEEKPAVLLAAHLDTVFPASTRLDIRREHDRLHGPGIGDNSLGVAALVVLPQILHALGATPAVDLLLTGNVGEEGLGNLRGMRAVMDAHPCVGAAIAVEGHNLGRVTHVAVGSHRLRVSVRGPGGHSWGDYGRPSAIHELGRFISAISTRQLPSTPKTTLNVGLVEGGVSVNTIAPVASCVVDLRSVDADALRVLADDVERAVSTLRSSEIDATFDVLGERPAGVVPLDSLIVRRAQDTLAALGIEAICDASSTDANIPISRGIPALCVGLTHGGNVHREDEFIELAPLVDGISQLVLLALDVADDLGVARSSPNAETAAVAR